MAKPQSILITGANRGLGLEMVKQILDKISPQFLFATYRDDNTSHALKELCTRHENLHLIKLDIKNHLEFPKVASFIESKTEGFGLNLLVNNGGIYHDEGQGFFDVTKETLMSYFETNTVGSFLLARDMFKLLEKGSKGAGKAVVVNISSGFASISNNCDGGYYASRPTRCALNALTKNMSVELGPKGILSICMSPGWVKTDQGGPNAPLEPKESVQGMLNVILNLNENDNGKFFLYNGEQIPW